MPASTRVLLSAHEGAGEDECYCVRRWDLLPPMSCAGEMKNRMRCGVAEDTKRKKIEHHITSTVRMRVGGGKWRWWVAGVESKQLCARAIKYLRSAGVKKEVGQVIWKGGVQLAQLFSLVSRYIAIVEHGPSRCLGCAGVLNSDDLISFLS